MAAGFDRQGLGLGDSLPGILGVQPKRRFAGLDQPGGFRHGDESQRRK
jgi:hypothetical protein